MKTIKHLLLLCFLCLTVVSTAQDRLGFAIHFGTMELQNTLADSEVDLTYGATFTYEKGLSPSWKVNNKISRTLTCV
jgi:hypothetical protein